MGPQARLEGCPHPAPAKERFMSGSGSPGRLQDNLSRDSGVGGLKVSRQNNLQWSCDAHIHIYNENFEKSRS